MYIMNPMDCIFCKIINKEIPSAMFYEDENAVAFLSISPTSIGHSLIVPKKHSRTALEMSADEFSKLSKAFAIVPNKIKSVVLATGINIIQNNESDAGQVVFHTHFHVIPRFPNDGLKEFPHADADKEELSALAEKLRSAF